MFLNNHKQNTSVSSQEEYNIDNDIILYITYNIPFVPRDSKSSFSNYFIPILIVWKDGRILLGYSETEGCSGNLNLWNYVVGEVDMNLIEEKQKNIMLSLGFNRSNISKNMNVNLLNYGVDSAHFRLYSFYENQRIVIDTWEKTCTTIDEKVTIVSSTGDKKEILISDFYTIWQKIKADIYCLKSTNIVSKKVKIIVDRMTINVSWEDNKIESSTSIQFKLP
jgi:hypothetical protein